MKRTGILALIAAWAAMTAAPANDFQALLDQEWQYELQTNPEMATAYGDKRFNAELSDLSPAFHARDLQQKQKFAALFEAIPPTSLSPADGLNRRLMLLRLQKQIAQIRNKVWEMPVDQMNGLHLELAQLPSNTTFTTAADYRDYVARLQKIPHALEQLEEVLRLGVRDGMMPPRYLLEQAQAQTEHLAKATGKQNPFLGPLDTKNAAAAGYAAAVRGAVEKDVAPAYAHLAQFLRTTYVPAGRKDPGIWAIPGGDAYYRQQIGVMTTTALSPREFHEIGLRQVEEITAEMRALAEKSGFHDLAAFHRSIAANSALHGKTGEQMLGLYTGYANQMRAKMPQLFGRQPKAPLAVVPMEAFRAANAVPADYSPGSADGTRPGRINVNEYNPTGRLLLNVEAIAYHEGIPGHHQQIALAQELQGLPEFRRHSEYNAFVEGWALYSERLGKEVGFYQDPYSDYGRLENEMWRAVRLVVDTGVHEMHWSRAKMIQFFHDHTAMDDTNVETEVDRYIAWPAQALGYKAGQIKILALRDRARTALGARFDLRRFHDAVLGQGALPLDVLEEQIDAWIEREKRGGKDTIAGE